MTNLPSLIGASALDELCELARSAPPGAIVEVGVYKGGSAVRLYEVAQQQGRTLYLYDTFEGHPHHHPMLDTEDHPLGRFADAADPAHLQRLMPHAVIVRGVFPDTLVDMGPVAFVHADGDLYQTTLDVCHSLPPRMVPGGMLYFDDYPHPECRGCATAVDECFPDRRLLPNGKALATLPTHEPCQP